MNQSRIACCVKPFYFELKGNDVYMGKYNKDTDCGEDVGRIGTLDELCEDYNVSSDFMAGRSEEIRFQQAVMNYAFHRLASEILIYADK